MSNTDPGDSDKQPLRPSTKHDDALQRELDEALGGMSMEDLLAGGQNGIIWVRDQNDVSALSSLMGGPEPNFGIGEPCNAVAVSPSGNMVLGFHSGLIVTRNPANPGADISSANYGTNAPIKALDVMPNGNVVIGLGNGMVDIRHETNLTVSLDSAVLGASVDAVVVTSNGNLWMGTSANLVFARAGTNLATQIGGPDGLNFNNSITALAAFPSGPPATDPVFESIAKGTAPDSVVIQWSSEAGRVYAVEEATDPAAGFTPLTNRLPANPPSNVFTADTQNATSAAFRVVSDPAP